MKTKKKKNPIVKRSKAFFPIAIWCLILAWCLLFLFLVAWGLMTSFKSKFGFDWNSYGIPPFYIEFDVQITDTIVAQVKEKAWAFDNYIVAFKNLWVLDKSGNQVFFGKMLIFTLYYCIVYAFVAVVAPMLCSYVYTKYSKRVPWVKAVWILVLISMYVPLSASLAASLKLAMELGIYDNIFLFVIASFGPFGGDFLIYYAIWKGLSWEYAEAAFMDGASHWTVLIKVMFPMTITVFWVLFVTKIIALWTDYSTPMVFLPSYPTLAYGVYRLQQNTTNLETAGVPIRLAALFAIAVPMFTLFMVFKEKMMGSLTMGGLKG
ncbi:MAG: carbohydrate ABC transporter permease [Clostridia bacterium]|nr:carbohydrate ABC transporter permease [Clostridia bacterium]